MTRKHKARKVAAGLQRKAAILKVFFEMFVKFYVKK